MRTPEHQERVMGERVTAGQARAGDVFSSGPRSTGFAEWNRFAAVNDEFVPIHMDDEAGRAAGYPCAISMGRLQWSYVHSMLRTWLAGEGRIVSVAMQFRGAVLKGSAFDIRARVTAVRDEQGEKLIDVDVSIQDADGTVLAPGKATVAVRHQGKRL
jgi:acyl dehydratase